MTRSANPFSDSFHKYLRSDNRVFTRIAEKILDLLGLPSYTFCRLKI
nr:MAG TPA: hypothetical protein [Caudoviricetes sp.]